METTTPIPHFVVERDLLVELATTTEPKGPLLARMAAEALRFRGYVMHSGELTDKGKAAVAAIQEAEALREVVPIEAAPAPDVDKLLKDLW